MSFEVPTGSPNPASPTPVTRGGPAPVGASGYTLLHLDDATADRTAFGERKGRFGGAFGTSVASHALIILLFYGLTILSVPALTPVEERPFDPSKMVWANVPGPGGGGGGGGNQMKEPPAAAQTKPVDKITVPVAKPTPQTPPKEIPKPTPDPPQMAMNIPVKPMDAGQVAQVGTIDAPSAPPTTSQGSGVGGGSGTGNGTGSGTGRGSGLGEGSGGGTGGGAYQIGNGVLPPELIHRTSPQYTAEAMRAKIQGISLLSGVVGVDGTLQDIRVARSLDGTFGLDQEAIKCVRQWRFRPGTKQGQAVPVYVTIEVAFNLR
ncbi:MAG: TonB family protein [Vicinamibacteraceae bacterium]